MLKRLLIVLALCGGIIGPLGCQGSEIIRRWRVEIGPAGNEFCEVPKPKAEKAEEETPPPSEVVLRWAKIIAPGAKVTEWKFKSDRYGYRIYAQVNQEEYRFAVTPKGRLLALEYENRATNVKEQAGELILPGTKKSIAESRVPKAALKTLAEAMPNARVSQAWTAQTTAGLRYVIVIDKMAFYARPDGQIQAARLLSEGALDEVKPADKQLEELLGQYRERFNFENQINRLGNGPRSANGSFRYVVMGDSRSQWEMWSSIVKHIASLEPKPDFVINSGDVVSRGYAKEYYQYYIRAMLQTDIPYLVAIGNHDVGADGMAKEYRYLFGEKALNYYLDYGNARYIFIDNVTRVQPYEQTLDWLDKTLADTPNGYRKYVCAHRPPKNIEKWAYHAWDDSNSRTFTDLMTKYKVDEVYLGHIHAYSTARYNGVNYTISGGGGAPLHYYYGPLGNIHHYVICDVMPDGTVKQQVVRFYK